MTCRLAVVILSAVAACTEPDEVFTFSNQPIWTEWPAEVRAGTPFDLRYIAVLPGCHVKYSLRIEAQLSDSAVLFNAPLVISAEDVSPCHIKFIDTAITVSGLAGGADRTYQLLLAPPPEGPPRAPNDSQPPRVLGSILVRPTGPLSDRVNVSGGASGQLDPGGCPVIRWYPVNAMVPIENPPAETWLGLVRGYLFTVATPMCGQTRAFHLDDVSMRAPQARNH